MSKKYDDPLKKELLCLSPHLFFFYKSGSNLSSLPTLKIDGHKLWQSLEWILVGGVIKYQNSI
jgi:hypothetical protein